MKLQEKLKEYENQYLFLRWATGGEYGKLMYVGEDFVEFNIIDVETMSYRETALIYAPLILEVSIGGADVARILAEVSSKMS
ncbi:unknown [Clostridium sp. CAG:813]|nr:unknown [Clostridium sp. CAG:813]